MLPEYLPMITLPAAGLILTHLAYVDLTTARIPNGAIALLAIAATAHVATVPDPTWHIGMAAVAFICLFFLWQCDLLGGGDVKLLPVVALILGSLFPAFLAALGAFAICAGVSRGMLPRLWQKRRDVPLAALVLPAFATVLIGAAI